MATTSSSGIPSAGTATGGAGKDLGYETLLADGADMDALVAEHLAHTGTEGILSLAAAVNAAPVLTGTHDAVAAVGALETLKCAATAKQADHSVAYQDCLVADRKRAGIREKNPAWGSSGDVALALHLSPTGGTNRTNDFRLLAEDLPRCHQGLRQGILTWDQVHVVISGTRNLKIENRRMLDSLLWEDTHTCFVEGIATLRDLVEYWALILEPETAEKKEEDAADKRYASGYQLNENTVRIVGEFPLDQGIPILQVLNREMERPREPGDERTNAQVAADTVFEALTDTKATGSRPVALFLIMEPESLTGDSDEPALIPGHGYISAARARSLVAGDPEHPLNTWYRRLYAAPETGKLVAMDSAARRFAGNLKRFISLRDQRCRTPHCNGRIQELDHIVQVRRNGKTTENNASGRCKTCNRTKEAPGWHEEPLSGQGRHSFKITTPSGHSYISTAPPLRPGTGMNRPPQRK
ncbi:DUF222 domain-containing protein [Paeniglutamicibacter psychrophenolicus]|uniref:HNH nuclease domain-containing protein n=1 Tax=Paeniglutamicibacter psychrophenolicus TaxID=257454 RepID=A0ABS4WJB8_9MICC|nr:DUF222 domain-containing protein [Paeniglutamicibacter psychrophenolicus]MBP2376290.1 hypothetical protein [Paeniglutamicibacter psychrophenolicus]